ncbi:MFS transporter [Rhodococcus sp. WS4]|nr:MFS transporter [Rhodococcus sp. WS4]
MARGRVRPRMVARPRGDARIPVLLGVLLGMTGLGSTAGSTVLPVMAADLHVALGVAAWSITVYALIMAVGSAIYGRLLDVVGIRTPFVVAMVLYASGALLAAVSPNFDVLIMARVLHSAGAAALPILSPALLSSLHDAHDRDRALGQFLGAAVVLGALGPVVGGIVGDVLGWRAVMALPLVGVTAFPFLWRALVARGSGARLDLAGAVVVSMTAAGAVLLLQSPATGTVVAAVGAVLLLLGVPAVLLHLRRRPDGFLPLTVLTNRVIARSAVCAAPVLAAWFALLITVPVVLVGRGWQPAHVGLALIPAVVVGLAMPRIAGQMLVTVGARNSLAWALSASTLALVLGGVGSLASLPIGLVAALLVGAVSCVIVAMSLGQPALTAVVAGAAEPETRGVALGTANLLFALGGGLGAAVVGGLTEFLGTPTTLGLIAAASIVGLASIRGVTSERVAAHKTEEPVCGPTHT